MGLDWTSIPATIHGAATPPGGVPAWVIVVGVVLSVGTAVGLYFLLGFVPLEESPGDGRTGT